MHCSVRVGNVAGRAQELAQGRRECELKDNRTMKLNIETGLKSIIRLDGYNSGRDRVSKRRIKQAFRS